jgi:hypothetical protein
MGQKQSSNNSTSSPKNLDEKIADNLINPNPIKNNSNETKIADNIINPNPIKNNVNDTKIADNKINANPIKNKGNDEVQIFTNDNSVKENHIKAESSYDGIRKPSNPTAGLLLL